MTDISTNQSFCERKKLYHYTSFKSSIKILENMTLKLGKLSHMNDVNERFKEILVNQPPFFTSQFTAISQLHKELRKIKQLSLTLDDRQPGFSISAMWGHYADSGKGVCLIFDYDKFVAKAKSYGFDTRRVKYTNECEPVMYDPVKFRNVKEYLCNSKVKKSIFFTKTNDWNYEQEYKIFTYDPDNSTGDYFDIQDCLIAICLYGNDSRNSVFNTSKYEKLKMLSNGIPVVVYTNSSIFGMTLSDGQNDLLGRAEVDVNIAIDC